MHTLRAFFDFKVAKSAKKHATGETVKSPRAMWALASAEVKAVSDSRTFEQEQIIHVAKSNKIIKAGGKWLPDLVPRQGFCFTSPLDSWWRGNLRTSRAKLF